MLCVLRTVGTRRNALTLTCRIPTEILIEIFLHYQRPYFDLRNPVPAPEDKGTHSVLYGTSLGWVPAVAHVCRHWRTVAHEHPRLWSNVVLHLGRAWAQRTLALSKASPIVVALRNPITCDSITPASAVSRSTRPAPTLDPADVLLNHLSHIQNLELRACACEASSWTPLLKAAAPLLEVLWLCIDPHEHGSALPNAPIALPDNFLATHPRIRRLYLEQAFLANWVHGPSALTQLVVFSIHAPDPRSSPISAATTLPTREQLLDSLALMPALEVLHLEHCLPAFVPAFSARTVSLAHLRTATLTDRVDRCRQLLDALDLHSTTRISVRCWSVSPLDTLRILPTLAAHISPSGGGPQALTLSSCTAASTSGSSHTTQLKLAAWRAFATPTVAEDCESYAGPKVPHDVLLECEWAANSSSSSDPEMERRALLRACECIALADLRALSLRADGAVWTASDWRATFAGCTEITHVLAFDVPAESLLEALCPPKVNAPLFQELVSLTLVGVNFVRAEEVAWSTLERSLVRRQKSPACVTILDRVELRACTVTEDAIDALKEFAAVVVWDSITDPNSWIHVPRDGAGDGEGEEEEEEDEDEDEDAG